MTAHARRWSEAATARAAALADEGLSQADIGRALGFNAQSIAYHMGPSRTGAASWTPERLELLVRLYNRGMTGSQIAHEMGITRNKAIAKLHRLGVRDGRAFDPRKIAGPADPKPPREARPKRQGQPKARSIPKPPKVRVEPAQRPAMRVSTAASPRPRTAPMPYNKIGPAQCRFGLDDPGHGEMDKMMCCAAPTVPGAPWCAEHRAICFHKPVVWERNAAR
jgi:hypothetical protein